MAMIDIFVPSDEIVPIEELLELTGEDNIAIMIDDEENFVGYRTEWDGLLLEATVFGDGENDEIIRQLQQHVRSWLSGRKDKKAQKVARRANGMRMVYRINVTPDWDMQRNAQQIVQGIMAYYDYALMAVADAVYNENGNREIGTEDSERKYWLQPDPEELASPEARARKAQSITQLKREKVAYIDHLPVIPDETEVTLRPVEDILKRAIALLLIAEYAESRDAKEYERRVKQYRLAQAITPAEQSFVQDADPREDYVLEFSQRWESSLLLLWALGIVAHLDRPEIFVSAEFLRRKIYDSSYDTLRAQIVLRPLPELLDLLDLTYRYHWAIIDAELYGNPPPVRLQPTIVYERHYALNWLIGFKNQDWDDVKTDT